MSRPQRMRVQGAPAPCRVQGRALACRAFLGGGVAALSAILTAALALEEPRPCSPADTRVRCIALVRGAGARLVAAPGAALLIQVPEGERVVGVPASLGHAPTWQQAPRDSMLTRYIDFVQRRWAEGCRNAAQLWRELVALGFKGRQNIVRRWAGQRRRTEPETGTSADSAAAPNWQTPTGRKLA